MAYRDVDIHQGMEVYDRDRQKIGRISDVYPDVRPSETSPARESWYRGDHMVRVEDTAPDYGPSGAMPPPEFGSTEMTGDISSAERPSYYNPPPETVFPGTVTGSMYFQVELGGILGFGGQELYVPFSAVVEVVPGTSLVIDCTKQQCSERFGQKPSFLQTGS